MDAGVEGDLHPHFLPDNCPRGRPSLGASQKVVAQRKYGVTLSICHLWYTHHRHDPKRCLQ